MAVDFHKYYIETSEDKELNGTTRHLYDVMLGLSRLDNGQVQDYSISRLGKCINRGKATTRFHLHKLESMGYIDCISQKNKHNPKWNVENLYIVYLKRQNREPSEGQEGAKNYTTPSQNSIVPPIENCKGKYSLEGLKEGLEDTLKREAELPKDSSKHDQITKSKSETLPPSQETENTPDKVSEYDLSGVPDIMRPVAEYLLLKTGRPVLKDKELEALQWLSQNHMPIRVLKEIDTCVERFKSDGRKLNVLYFGYIAACLGKQKSYAPEKQRTKRNKRASKTVSENATVQEDVADIVSDVLPVEEAEKIIADYSRSTTTEQKNDDEIPVALQELYMRMQDHNAEIEKRFWKEWGEYCDRADENELAPDREDFTLEDYLRLKFPEADEEELHTDYEGNVHENYEDFPQIGRIDAAFSVDFACAFCDDPKECALPKGVRRGHEYPIAKIFTNQQGHKCLGVSYGKCLKCKHGKAQKQTDPEFEARVKRSGLSETQTKQTFTAYSHAEMPAEIVSAKAKAILAAKNHTSLILAGKPGTGKTHLAVSIAIEAMREGKQALFRNMSELLDELWQADWDHADFSGLMQKYKDAPCLVLDDWGKEKATEKRLEYLFKLIDYRYRHGMQTILTTNALDMSGLMNDRNADKIEPLVSRILENGEWVTIKEAENHRIKKIK